LYLEKKTGITGLINDVDRLIFEIKESIMRTCIEDPLFDAVLSPMPKLPSLDLILGTLFLTKDQHDHGLKEMK